MIFGEARREERGVTRVIVSGHLVYLIFSFIILLRPHSGGPAASFDRLHQSPVHFQKYRGSLRVMRRRSGHPSGVVPSDATVTTEVYSRGIQSGKVRSVVYGGRAGKALFPDHMNLGKQQG